MRGRLTAVADLWLRRIEGLVALARERLDAGDVDGAIRALNRAYFRELTILGFLLPHDRLHLPVTHPGTDPLLHEAVSWVGGELDTPPDGDATH